jgi:UDP:flavonoid glycosyltransferase YjiC (YdhE family)
MRILLTSRGSAGHLTPLTPFGHAALRAGHEVLVTAQRQHAGNVERADLPFAPVDEPPPDQWMPLLAEFAQMDLDTSNAAMIGEYFARLDTAAALPRLREIVEEWRPDVIVRECWEFASTLVAELHDVPVVRVALGLASLEELTIRLAAPALDAARAGLGLPADPAGDRLRDTPCFTAIPERLEDPSVPASGHTQRFRHGTPTDAPPLPDWWPGNDDPLVYVTFGSVSAGPHLPYFPALYRAAIAALAPLPVRVLLTIGDRRDHGELGPLPPNVHVEEWVPQDAVAPHAAAIVCHGGHGSTLGAIGHGVPLVVVPLFSGDQWLNAAAVERAGAGIALDAERDTRPVLGLPGPATVDALGPAVQRVLAEPVHRRGAQRLAAEMLALPSTDAAVDALAALSAAPRRAPSGSRERP